MGLIIALLAVWILLAVLGLVVDVLKWLVWIAIILIVITAAVGVLMRSRRRP